MDFYQNDKNIAENSSGIHSDMDIDSNYNQLNGEYCKILIQLMIVFGGGV